MAKNVSDSMLLERFVSRREEAAFVDLVKRHGPRVEGTCRRLLHNEQDVEDVFQATFLVLARKAAGIPWRDSVGGWLCAVAHRLAMNVRVDASRHRRRETPFAVLRAPGGASADGDRLPEQYHPLADPFIEIERRELREVLDDELLRLPEKYRAPVVLCDLQGRSHQEAAAELGWPSGSISRRLMRARALLRRRLVHRGVFLATGLAVVGLAAFLTFKATQSADRDAMKVRPLMISLKPIADDRTGLSNTIVRLTREHPTTDELAGIIARGRRAAEVATELESHKPDRNQDQWRAFAGEMRLAAEQLVQNTQANSPLAMLAAAHRLDATCLKCHEVFRQ
jgi:RNA polymerase sigma factor (sigma-70 family)